jgi:AraC-like DNA-binding protein
MTQIPDKDTTYILLQIPESEMHKHLPTFGQLRFQTYISPEDTGKTGKHPGICLMEMLDEYTRKEDGYPLLFLARLYELLYVLYRDHTTQALHPGGAMGRDIKRMTQVMDWVQENYQQPLTLGEAAERSGLSREYFCRMFKRYTGQTFLEYLTAERAMHLYDALKTSDSSLTLLMEQNGITNYKVFMRAFKKLYGDTPQKIRKSLLGQP